MKKEILMSLEVNEKRVAILEDGKLEEFFIERADAYKMFGNIYKGKVKSIVPGIGAAFIDLGTKKDGFLYVADAIESPFGLDSPFEEAEPAGFEGRRERGEIPRIDEVLKIGQEVFVQVVKEPIRDKGPRLTTHVAIPARYLVLIPGESKVSVSRRIDDPKDREQIRQIFSEIELPKECGFIVRTAGEGKTKREFVRDVKYLAKVWSRIKSDTPTKKAPSLIHQELDLVERIIRDYFTEDMDRIVVDHAELYKQVRRFMRLYLPGCRVQVEWFKSGAQSLFEKYNIEKEIEKTFQKKVYLRSGGHIVIEQTESLVAIDVNTGKFTGHRDLEETVYRTNLEAAGEVARQVRLRDMGGIIITDFIDMVKPDHRRHLYRLFKDVMKKDRAKTNILQMSELGLVEMTRQRIRPSLESAVYNTCSYCDGKGVIKSVITMAIEAVKEIKRAMNHSKDKVLNVYVHPQVAERLLREEHKSIRDLEQASRSRIMVLADPTIHREDINITFVK